MGNPAPGFKNARRNHIVTRPARKRVRVTLGAEVLADSREALEMREGSYPPVYYVPRKDVKVERLMRTSLTTHCPYKGDASYYSIVDGPENAVWSYEQPYDEMLDIRDLLAFYPNKVAIALGDD